VVRGQREKGMTPHMVARGCVVVVPEGITGLTVAEAMVHAPKTLPLGARAAQVRALFDDDHVHVALIVDCHGRLRSVVERADLSGHDLTLPASALGCLVGRTVTPDADLVDIWRAMTRRNQRRLAVVDPSESTLLGLLCLKRSGLGFCSDADVAARQSERCK
jgi:CBS domain